MIVQLLFTDLNPTPWMAPDLSIGRGKGGRVYPQAHSPASMKAYQAAITEAFEQAYPNHEPFPKDTPLFAMFFYWRKRDTYKTPTGRTSTAKRADVTNINKATEDALQGLLYVNDVDNVTVYGRMVEQDGDADPQLLIVVSDDEPVDWVISPIDPVYPNYVVDQLDLNVTPPNPPGNVYLKVTP